MWPIMFYVKYMTINMQILFYIEEERKLTNIDSGCPGVFSLIYLFIYFWLRWVFVAVRRLSLVAMSRGYSSLQCPQASRCGGFSC